MCEIRVIGWCPDPLYQAIRTGWKSILWGHYWVPTVPSFYASCIHQWWVWLNDQSEYFSRDLALVLKTSHSTVSNERHPRLKYHPFSYRRVYSYADKVSHLWIRPEANCSIAFVSPNRPQSGLWQVTMVKYWPYFIWWNIFTLFITTRPSLSICA